MKKRTLVFMVCVVFILVLGAGCGGSKEAPASAAAEAPLNYPTRAITMTAQGGVGEATQRVIAEFMAEACGQPIIVESLQGAGGVLQLTTLQQRPSDGYTIGYASPTGSPWAHIASSPDPGVLPWKTDDFVVIAGMTMAPASIGIAAYKNRWKDLPAMIEEAKTKPGALKLGVTGPRRVENAQVDEFQEIFGIKFNVVYYGGPDGVQTDLITKDLDLGVFGANRADMVDNPNIQVLALFGESVPSDFGVQGLPLLGDYLGQYGLKWSELKKLPLQSAGTTFVMKADTDPRIVKYWRDLCRDLQNNPAYITRLKQSSWPSFQEPAAVISNFELVAQAVSVR